MGGVLKKVKGQKTLSPAYWSIRAWKKKFYPIIYVKDIRKLADQHEERMINVLYKLEDDVIKEVTKATKGELVSQRLAIQLQPRLRQIVEENF